MSFNNCVKFIKGSCERRIATTAVACASAAPTELKPQIGGPARLSDGSNQGKEETAERELRKQLHCDTLPAVTVSERASVSFATRGWVHQVQFCVHA